MFPSIPYFRLIIAGVAALAIAFGLYLVYDAGYSRAAVKWEAKYELREAQIRQQTADEKIRQAQANAEAALLSAARIARLQADNAARDQKIKELSDEADADPDRDNACLSDGSRLRIDAIH